MTRRRLVGCLLQATNYIEMPHYEMAWDETTRSFAFNESSPVYMLGSTNLISRTAEFLFIYKIIPLNLNDYTTGFVSLYAQHCVDV